MQAIGSGIAATSSPIFFHSIVFGGAAVSWYAYSWYLTIFAQLGVSGGSGAGRQKGDKACISGGKGMVGQRKSRDVRAKNDSSYYSVSFGLDSYIANVY